MLHNISRKATYDVYVFRKLGRFCEKRHDTESLIGQTMIRLNSEQRVYFSIRRPSPKLPGLGKEKGSGRGEKRGTRICFHWHTRAKLGSFRKNLFSRANYVAAATRHEASPVSPSCILPSVASMYCRCRRLVGDESLFTLRRGTGANDHDNSVPSSMTARHIQWKAPIGIKGFFLSYSARRSSARRHTSQLTFPIRVPFVYLSHTRSRQILGVEESTDWIFLRVRQAWPRQVYLKPVVLYRIGASCEQGEIFPKRAANMYSSRSTAQGEPIVASPDSTKSFKVVRCMTQMTKESKWARGPAVEENISRHRWIVARLALQRYNGGQLFI